MIPPAGPLRTLVTFRDGPSAAKRMARRWGLERRHDQISFTAADMRALYDRLIRICYLTPVLERHLRGLLPLFNARGRLGQAWLRRQIGKSSNVS